MNKSIALLALTTVLIGLICLEVSAKHHDESAVRIIKVRQVGEAGERVFKRAADKEEGAEDADSSESRRLKKKAKSTARPKHGSQSGLSMSSTKPASNDATTGSSTTTPPPKSTTTTPMPSTNMTSSMKPFSPRDYETEILGKMERAITEWLGFLTRYGPQSARGRRVIAHVMSIKRRFYPWHG